MDGRLCPYFLLFQWEHALGVPPHPATNEKLFAYNGELIHGQGTLVESKSVVQLVPSSNCAQPTIANIAAQLVTDPHLAHLGPYAVGDADTLEIRMCSITVVPNKYVGLFVSHPKGVTPRYYFETILPVIEADRFGPTCMPLMYFCQMAFTRAVGGGPSPIQVVEPPPQVATLHSSAKQLRCSITTSPL